MHVLGMDIVGGILGDSRGVYQLTDPISKEYHIYGRNATGGITGRIAGGKIISVAFDAAMTGRIAFLGVLSSP